MEVFVFWFKKLFCRGCNDRFPCLFQVKKLTHKNKKILGK